MNTIDAMKRAADLILAGGTVERVQAIALLQDTAKREEAQTVEPADSAVTAPGRPCKIGGPCVPTRTSSCACRDLPTTPPSSGSGKQPLPAEREALEGEARQVAVPQEPIAHICILSTKYAGPTKFFTAPSDPRGFPVYAAPQPPQAEQGPMPTSLRPPRTAQEFKFGMNVLDWNRKQESPPIDIGRELWVADEVAKFFAPQAQPDADLTDAEIDAITKQQWGDMTGHPLTSHRAAARAVLALQKAKNEAP